MASSPAAVRKVISTPVMPPANERLTERDSVFRAVEDNDGNQWAAGQQFSGGQFRGDNGGHRTTSSS